MKTKPIVKIPAPKSARKRVKARRWILLHEKSGTYSDYTLQPNATDAHFAKLAAECSERKAIVSPVFVLPADAQSIEEMREQLRLAEHHAPRVNFAMAIGEKWADFKLRIRSEENARASHFLASLNLIAPPKQKGGK